MDTYENLTPEEENQMPKEENLTSEEESQIPTQEAQQSDSFYHGVGTGAVESTGMDQSQREVPPVFPTESAPKPKKKRFKPLKMLLKRMGVGALVLVLVAAGTAGSAAMMNYYWNHQNRLLQKSFNERISVLQQQLEEYKNQKNEEVTIPVEGLVPSQVYEQNIDSVVAVNCTIQLKQNGQSFATGSSGSGFVLSDDGYIVTNHHVIDGASSITVTWHDSRTMDAKLIGSDSVNDIALLKVDAKDLRPVRIGSSSALGVGDQVVAIGNALGELSFSLTVGYVSGTDRDVSTDGTMQTMIQTDASINSGNSGGPLFNAQGEVVGITTAKYSGTTSSGASIEGIGFAIPMDDVYGMFEDLIEYGYIKSAYLGVTVRDVEPTAHQLYGVPMGALVDSVGFGSCAHRGGIQPKDIIVNLGGYDVRSLSDLTRVLRNFEPGEEATVTLWRMGNEVVKTLIFDEKPHN